jgi:carbonic anhydrase
MRLLLILTLSACAHPPPLVWSYGEPWGGECTTGKQQSPVALSGAAGFAPTVQLEYWPSRIKLTNTGKTLRLDYDPGSFIIVDGKRAKLEQLHFHHPGEHSVDGKTFPLEMHLVHKTEDGKFVVVAVLIAEGALNRWMKPLLAELPRLGETLQPTARLNAADLVPPSRIFLHYSGSLTAPPCSEGVQWFVMRTPIEMSADQIAALGELLGDNHRAVQPLGDRKVIEGEAR